MPVKIRGWRRGLDKKSAMNRIQVIRAAMDTGYVQQQGLDERVCIICWCLLVIRNRQKLQELGEKRPKVRNGKTA